MRTPTDPTHTRLTYELGPTEDPQQPVLCLIDGGDVILALTLPQLAAFIHELGRQYQRLRWQTTEWAYASTCGGKAHLFRKAVIARPKARPLCGLRPPAPIPASWRYQPYLGHAPVRGICQRCWARYQQARRTTDDDPPRP